MRVDFDITADIKLVSIRFFKKAGYNDVIL